MPLTLKNFYTLVPLNPISDLTVVWWDTEATITWTDPVDLASTTWVSTKLVRKVGSAPTDSTDWTLVVTETVRDTYSVSWYNDTWLTNGTTYYYAAFAVWNNWLETISSTTPSVTPAQQWWNMDNWTLAQTSNTLWSGFYTWVYVKPDGTKIFFSDAWQQRIYECTLWTPFDISSLSLTKYISTAFPEDMTFSPDGTKMFVLKSDSSPYQVKRYTLSTAWDISTATQDQTITAWTENGDRWLYITPDGLTIYRSMAWQATLHKATMTTAWDLTTASAWDSKSNYGWIAIWFGNDWKFFARKPDGNTSLYWYELSTPYDLSTISASWNKVLWWSDYGLWLCFNNTWTIAFTANGNYHNIRKYTL